MPDQFGMFSNQFRSEYTKEQNEQYTSDFTAITDGFAQAMASGLGSVDEIVQALVKRHYDFICQFWTPTKAAYKSLAMSYLLPTPYRETYERVAPGLAKYHYDAIIAWAEANLAD